MTDVITRHINAVALALGLAVLSGTALPAGAADTGPPILSSVIERLEAEGYGIAGTRRSWFGRIVILATQDGFLREIVINRTTGSVLSDRLFAAGSAGADTPGAAAPAMDPPAPSGTGGGGTSQAKGSNGAH